MHKGNFSMNRVQIFLGSSIVPDLRQNEYANECLPKTFMQRSWPPLIYQANAAQLHFVTEDN